MASWSDSTHPDTLTRYAADRCCAGSAMPCSLPHSRPTDAQHPTSAPLWNGRLTVAGRLRRSCVQASEERNNGKSLEFVQLD